MADKDAFQTVKDILLMEIPLPFSSGKEGGEGDSLTPEQEMEAVLKKLEAQGKDVGSLLVERGLLSQSQLERVREEQEKSGLGFSQALVRLKVVSPARVSSVIGTLGRVIMEEVSGHSLKQVLLDEKVVSEEDIKKAEALSRKSGIDLAQALLELKKVSLAEIGKIYEKHYSIPYVDLKKEKLESRVVRMIPENIMRERRLIAFKKKGNELSVGMIDPRDQTTVDRLQIITGCKILPHFVDLRALAPVLRKYVPDIDEGKARLQDLATNNIQQAAEDESTVNLVNKIIEGAINARATDVHLDPQEDHLRVRYRIDGMLYDIMTIQASQMVPVTARAKVMAEMNITERRRPQDGHITFMMDDRHFDLRMATLPTHLGEKIVMRLLDDTNVLKGMRQLGLDEKDLEKVSDLIRRPYGMFLVTGPIGSGKTTTLYAALSEVNQANRNLITIEDPIEYQLPGINQVQVDPNIDLSFAEGLRGILRQDADILMVGEIRDSETARTAVRAAMTGHLLFSTLHTNYSVNAITTLRHLDIQPFLIAGSVICVVAQRLVRRVCPECAESYVPPIGVREELGLARNSRKNIKRAVGCAECYHTGYLGRTGVYEVLALSDKIKNMIVADASEGDIIAQAKEEGMTTLAENGRKKVLEGETTIEEFMRVIYA